MYLYTYSYFQYAGKNETKKMRECVHSEKKQKIGNHTRREPSNDKGGEGGGGRGGVMTTIDYTLIAMFSLERPGNNGSKTVNCSRKNIVRITSKTTLET